MKLKLPVVLKRFQRLHEKRPTGLRQHHRPGLGAPQVELKLQVVPGPSSPSASRRPALPSLVVTSSQSWSRLAASTTSFRTASHSPVQSAP